MAKEPTVTELLEDHQEFHSDFQMDNMIVLAAGETPYAHYKQALRELYGRRRNLRLAYIDLAKLRLQFEVAEAAAALPAVPGAPSPAMQQLNADTFKLQIEEAARVIADTEREFLRFYAQAVALREELGGIPLTEERRAELDEQMWLKRRPDLADRLKEKPNKFKKLKVEKVKKPKDLIEEDA